MSAQESRIRRTRETLAVLAELSDESNTMPSSEVWEEVIRRVPLDEKETELLPSGGTRGRKEWQFSGINLVKAGWLQKGEKGHGLWTITEEGRRALDQWPDSKEFLSEAASRYSAWIRARDERSSEKLATVVLPTDTKQERILEVAQEFVDKGLTDGASVFSMNRTAWTKTAAQELMTSFAEAESDIAGGFIDRLAPMLSSVSDEAKLLMSEIVALQLLPIAEAMGQRAKTERVNSVLSLMEHPVSIPQNIISAFAGGAFNPGPGMMAFVADGVTIIVRLVDAWLDLDIDEQETALKDPFVWREFVYGIKGPKLPSQRNALLYLVHPEFFGPVVSERHKLSIRDAFIGEVGESSGDLDEDLFRITTTLQQATGGPVQFYSEPLHSRWKSAGSTGDNAAPSEALAATEPRPIAVLADELHMPEEWLEHQIEVLKEKRQVVFYGPPGTGKTFLALALGRHISGSAETTTIVQFHPSYSYEDFFEGYRPVTDPHGALTFALRPGPLRRIADAARTNPEFKYVLVIDEINRGNLAKIFGELYFLLEYRDQAISLLYQSSDDQQAEQFTLPKNVLIIGTMNTADRSIALMDSAMRRRFAFIELHPDRAPIKGMFESWLSGRSLADVLPGVLAELNRRIPDDAFKIGPSYFMKPALTYDRLRIIWELEILPLLEEMHYGDGTDVASRYALASILRNETSVPEGEADL